MPRGLNKHLKRLNGQNHFRLSRVTDPRLATIPQFFAQPKILNVRECLEQIIPGKKWGINIKKNAAWLELMSREEAEVIINYFKEHHYNDIALMYTRGTEAPVVFLKSLDLENLNRIASPTIPVLGQSLQFT